MKMMSYMGLKNNDKARMATDQQPFLIILSTKKINIHSISSYVPFQYIIKAIMKTLYQKEQLYQKKENSIQMER